MMVPDAWKNFKRCSQHSEKMNAMKKLVEQQLRDEHALNHIPAAHALRAQEIERCFERK